MLNIKTNKIVIAAIAAFAVLGMSSAASARIDDLPLSAAKPAHLRSAADLIVARMHIRAVDLPLATASLSTDSLVAPDRGRAGNSYNVFRSVVVPVGKLAAFRQWGSVSPVAATRGAGTCANDFCATAAGRTMADAAASAAGLPTLDALQLVNRAVNRSIRYRAEKGDHWATLAESARRGAGDCEDYAIAKMTLLRSIGFSAEQLQFIVLKDTRKQMYHAVLAVHVDGRSYILDNMSNSIATDDVFRSYVPIVSFVGGKSYVHGFTDKSRATALGKGGYAAIQLGEGS